MRIPIARVDGAAAVVVPGIFSKQKGRPTDSAPAVRSWLGSSAAAALRDERGENGGASRCDDYYCWLGYVYIVVLCVCGGSGDLPGNFRFIVGYVVRELWDRKVESIIA